MTKISHCKIH